MRYHCHDQAIFETWDSKPEKPYDWRKALDDAATMGDIEVIFLKLFVKENDAKFQSWVQSILANRTDTGKIKTTGAMQTIWFIDSKVKTRLSEIKDAPVPESSLITVTDKDLVHSLHIDEQLKQGKKRPPDRIIALQDAERLPELIRNAKAVLYDVWKPAILYLFNTHNTDKSGKWAVKININNKQNGLTSNAIASGAYINNTEYLQGIKSGQYKLLLGSI